jgi:AraC-like DNA-binding protein
MHYQPMSDHLYTSSAYALLFLRGSRLPADQVLADTGLTEAGLQSSDYISSVHMGQILRNIEASEVEPGWSVRIGAQLSVSTHGPLGFAALSAPTLGAALQVMAEFHQVRVSTMSVELQQVGKRLRFAMYDITGDEAYARWVFEVTLKVLESLIETIMGHPVGDQVTISFTHPAPEYIEVFEQAFGAVCEFGASHTAISIPSSWQHIPSPLCDEGNYHSNIAKCREIIAAHDQGHDPVQQVRNILASHFDRARSGELAGSTPPSLEHIADGMHLTTRTLIRRLKSGNSSYRELLELARSECAETLLAQASLNMAEVGERLGYGDPANFGRAFRRWKGVSPAAWRRGMRA